MGRYLTKTVFLDLTPLLLLHLLISSSSGAEIKTNESGVCISEGSQFLPLYEPEGNLSKSADVELKDLNLRGKVFHWKKTTHSASQMQSASLAIKNLATYGEADKDCLDLFELLEYQPTRVCASFCDRVFEACSDAYFSSIAYFDNKINATKQVIVPCGGNEDIICGKASKWESNGTAFCNAAGFTVHNDSEEEPCYGSNASLELVMESEPSKVKKTEKFEWFRDLPQILYEAELIEIELWIHFYVQQIIMHFFRFLFLAFLISLLC